MSKIAYSAIKTGLRSRDQDIALTAARCCENKDIPFHTILEWSKSDFWIYQCAALYACIGKSDPKYISIVGTLSQSNDDFVRVLANEIIQTTDPNG